MSMVGWCGRFSPDTGRVLGGNPNRFLFTFSGDPAPPRLGGGLEVSFPARDRSKAAIAIALRVGRIARGASRCVARLRNRIKPLILVVTNTEQVGCDDPRRSCIVSPPLLEFQWVLLVEGGCRGVAKSVSKPAKILGDPSKPQQKRSCRGGEMADTGDLKSPGRKAVRVRVPPAAPTQAPSA